jgi:hypothetical protein
MGWERVHFTKGAGNPFILFAVYGSFPNDPAISSSKYRTNGPPDGTELRKINATEASLPFTDPELLHSLEQENQELARTITASPQCILISGEIPDAPNLQYLRDCIGVIAYFLDNGGIAVADPQQLRFYDAQEWRDTFFQDDEPFVMRHVSILYSPEEENAGRWYHTRGMRKFGRPDLNLHNVPPALESPTIAMMNRFIELQALGGIVPEGQQIRMASLPSGLVCHNKGSFDDPDFNNVHLEIVFPKTEE